jgi:chorismate mutase
MVTLKDYRKTLEALDYEIATLIGKRLKLCAEIGHFKKSHGLSAGDDAWEREVHRRFEQWEKEFGLTEGELQAVFTTLIKYSRKLQSKIIEES